MRKHSFVYGSVFFFKRKNLEWLFEVKKGVKIFKTSTVLYYKIFLAEKGGHKAKNAFWLVPGTNPQGSRQGTVREGGTKNVGCAARAEGWGFAPEGVAVSESVVVLETVPTTSAATHSMEMPYHHIYEEKMARGQWPN